MKISDAAGRLVPIYLGGWRSWFPRTRAELSRADFDRICRATEPTWTPRSTPWVNIAYSVMCIASLIWMWFSYGFSPVPMLLIASVPIILLQDVLMPHPRIAASHADKLAAAMVSLGRCPSCLYPLPAPPAGAAGAVVVCSECGAHWHAPAPVEPAVTPRGNS